jgi:nucleoside-diphosphate-sugar epimerase
LTRNCDYEITATTPVEAKDSYATWKLAAEYLLQEYSGPKTTLILASVLSPRLTIGAIPAFTRRILKKEPIKVTDTYRDYLDPKSFIFGLTQLMESSEVLEKLVLGSGYAISTLELLKITAKILNKNLNQIDFELIKPKYSDPKKITLDPKWRQSFMTSENVIERCVSELVRQLKQSKDKIRSHHLEEI